MTAGRPLRVLVVDDSAFARKVLREALSRHPGIEVVGIARDGLEALESIESLKPDVVTLDLVMPNLDGLGVLKELHREGGPRIVVVSISDQESTLGVEALQRGAVALVQKPTALATDQLYQLSQELVDKVLEAGMARNRSASLPVAPPGLPHPRAEGRAEVVVVGTSTGGPQALTRLLAALPAAFPVPLVIALHIPGGYTHALAQRLDDACAISVVEAADGMPLRPGTALIARGGLQLTLRRQGAQVLVHLDVQPVTATHAPSVDVLFHSAVEAFGSKVLGVVLTGMGDDGLAGAGAITRAGGAVLTESESSCIVYGMPRSVHEAGLSMAHAPIENMAELIIRHL